MDKDASYFIISEEYLVSNIPYVLFSTVFNDKKTLLIDSMLPYFYIKEEDYKKNTNTIQKILKNYQFNIVESSNKNFQDEVLVKIYLNSPKEVPKLRNELFDEGILSFESDIRFTQRFKMDNNLFAFINPKNYGLLSKKSRLNDFEDKINKKLQIKEKIISKNTTFQETNDSFEYLKKEIFRNYANYYDEIIFLPEEYGKIDYSKNYFDILSLDIETIEDSVIMISAIYSKVNMDNSINDSISYSYILQNPINSFKKEDLNLSKNVLDFKNYKIIDTKAKYFDSEKEMLIDFFEDIKKHNPDFITGWNVIDFDLAFLKKVSTKYEIPFELSRKKEESSLILYSDFLKTSKANFFGRIVLDGIDLLKENFVKIENYKLDTASKEILKNQKIEIEEEKIGKYESIIKQWKEGSNKLIEYNLKDSGLVLDILTEIKLITLIIHRSQITGLVVDRVNSAIQALDSLYVRKANQNNVICNNVNSNSSGVGVEGAYVLTPKKGIYENVCVFDFKSLYPSIILTYNIDPYSFSGTINEPKLKLSKPISKFRKDLIDYFKIKDSDEEIIKILNDEKSYETKFKFYFEFENERYIISPNGTFFSQKKSLLKDLIKNVWQLRDQAKKEKDDVKSFALKITMNSFAGSLGNANCRIHNSKVMSTITGFGRLSIKILKQFLEENKIKVLYGDTDSVFVLSNKADYNQVNEFGKNYEKKANEFNENRIKEQYDLDSKLYLEFEKIYSKFLLLGVKKRYAGMKIINSKGNNTEKELEVVGMEIVRSDWTDIAKKVQQNVLDLIFNEKDVKSYLTKIIKELYAGKLDDELVYRKKIRKSLSEYVKTTPPHVKAARQLEKLESNIIEYIITIDGPQPIQKLTSKIDYEHYIEKQIKGAIDSILSALNLNFDDIINKSEQKNLFDF